MKFSLSWLASHLETEASLAEITAVLPAIGFEVEEVIDRAAPLAPFLIAHVIEAVPHPNADRLRLCHVDAGGEPIQVVCGAPNAHTGMKAVFAPPGSVIPGTGDTLKTSVIRGVQSAGMLLSEREMALGTNHDGIVELDPNAPVGESYAHWAGLDDPVISIAITPDRGDALSVRGIARDLAAAGLGRLKPWSAEAVAAKFTSALVWRTDWPEACPFVLGRTFRNLRNGESPRWLRDKLTTIGLRPINALVDITNFFTFDIGRPLHVFDVAKVTGATLMMRRGAGETFRALNGQDITVGRDDCVIADASGVVSLGGIMGGEATGCDEGTTTAFLECALFDPVRVAATGRRLQISSDARMRFERGIDAALMEDATEAVSRMILELCGGEASVVVRAGEAPEWQRRASLRFARLAEFGGLAVAPDEAVETLERLGFGVEKKDARSVTVAVPPWRNDVAAPLSLALAPELSAERAEEVTAGAAAIAPEADLIEEVLRIRSLDSIPAVSLPVLTPVPTAAVTRAQKSAAHVRRRLAARGLEDCVSFSFVAAREASLFGASGASLTLDNPLAADLDHMRPTPLASLALAAARNAARGFADLALFEVGPGFAEDAPEQQRTIAAGIRTGATARSWALPSRPVEWLDAKGDALAALAALGVPEEGLDFVAPAATHYHPGRSALIQRGAKLVLGQFGELHPSVVAALDLPRPTVAFEIFLDAAPEPKHRAHRASLALSALQPLRRDFAFVVDEAVPAQRLLRAAHAAGRNLITGVALFDVFTGGTVGTGKKSLAIEVTMQPRERTLTDAEIEAACQKIVAAVVKATGAVLRG